VVSRVILVAAGTPNRGLTALPPVGSDPAPAGAPPAAHAMPALPGVRQLVQIHRFSCIRVGLAQRQRPPVGSVDRSAQDPLANHTALARFEVHATTSRCGTDSMTR
jgi:hypothetical protein